VRATSRNAWILTGLVCLAATGFDRLFAQTAPTAKPARPARDATFEAGTTAVVVDVIVRDGRGEPVRDLTLADFELREDGVVQRLLAFTPPAIGAAAPPGADPAAPSASATAPSGAPAAGAIRAPLPPRPGRLVALVFDRLSPEARALAYQGALAYVESANAEDRIGVFLSDLRVETIQDYTSDHEALRRAVRDAATRATSVFDKAAQQPANRNPDTHASAHPGVPDVASPEQQGRVAIQDGKPYDRQTLEAVGLKPADSFWERMARDQQGFATTSAIEAIAAGLAAAPGRKALVFFAEGLAIPDAVLPRFERAVATANRAEVSIYSVDAKGLRVHSDQAEIRREVGAIGAAGVTVGPDGGSLSSLSLLERNEDVLRKDAETSLRLLANRTGGLLVNNTNDLGRVAGLVDLDFRDHYVLTYQPANGDFRGEWRAIEVKVPGRRVTVRARAGYLAVKQSSGTGPLLAHEARAQAALDRTPAPTGVPVQLATLIFPEPPGPARIALLVSTPVAAVATTAGDRYDAEFTILARIRDASGAVVQTASEPYRVGGPLAGATEAPGRVLFYRQPRLPPGRYAIEAAVADASGTRAGVARASLDVPGPPASGIDISSLVVVESSETAGQGADTANPLISGGRLLYPSLSGEATPGSNGSIGLFFRVVGAQAAPASSKLRLVRDGAALSEVQLPLPAPDASGRIDFQARLPTGTLVPGTYDLRLVVNDGTAPIERRATFHKSR